MQTLKLARRQGFTLIELLVVVAIIALLISILLPSLTCAREKARAAKCGIQLKQFGTGLATYYSENNDWIPGVNTTGIETEFAVRGGNLNELRRPNVPVQIYDWMTPFMRYETDLGANRAEQFRTLINDYACPSVQSLTVNGLYGVSGVIDSGDFNDQIIGDFAPLSYLMPMSFQWWGQSYRNTIVATGLSAAGRPITAEAQVSPSEFEVVHQGQYASRLDKVGRAANKIAAADGLRYMDVDDAIDFDVDPSPNWFGAFCTSGGWWCGSQAYGVKNGTTNWDGTVVQSSSSTSPAAEGRGLAWSYRHGCSSVGKMITSSVHDNPGEINALFFDAHVARLDDRASRNIEYWYPSGSTVIHPAEGLTDVEDHYEVP